MFSFMQLVVLLSFFASGGLPLGLPPAAEDPVVANVAPEACLFYMSWAGMAKPDPKSGNQCEQLLAEAEVRQLAAEVERRIREAIHKGQADAGPEAVKTADDITDLVEKLLTSPAAGYVAKIEVGPFSPTFQAGAIVGLGDDAAKVRAVWERFAKESPQVYHPNTVAGETLWNLPAEDGSPQITLGVHGKYFIIGIGDGEAEAIVKRMKGHPPAWLAQVRRQLPVERPSGVMYLNMNMILGLAASLPFTEGEESAAVRALGLDNFTYMASVSGLEGTGLVTKTFLGATKPEGDFLSFLNARPLEPKDLASIPRDATLAEAVRFDADRFFETVLTVASKIDELGGASGLAAGIAQAERALGLKVREDILQPLGDTWTIYNSPGEGGLLFTGLTAVARLKDPQRAAQSYQKLMGMLKETLDQQAKQNPRHALQLTQQAVAGRTVYSLAYAGSDPPPLGGATSWCMTDKELIVSLFPEQVKAYLSRGPEFQSLASQPEVAELFRSQPGPVVIGYLDTAEVFRLVYPLAQVGVQYLTRTLQREGIDVDASLLPSAASINKHLRPSVYSVRRDKTGIQITVRQSLPAGGMVAALPILTELGLPFFLFRGF